MWLHVLIHVLHRSFEFSTEFRYLRLQSPGLCYSVKGCSIPCHAFQATSACTGRLSIFLLSNLFDFPWSILTLSGWGMSWVISWDHCVSSLLYQGHLCVSCAPCPRFMCWKQQDVRIFWPTLLITAFYTSISSPSFNTQRSSESCQWPPCCYSIAQFWRVYGLELAVIFVMADCSLLWCSKLWAFIFSPLIAVDVSTDFFFLHLFSFQDTDFLVLFSKQTY